MIRSHLTAQAGSGQPSILVPLNLRAAENLGACLGRFCALQNQQPRSRVGRPSRETPCSNASVDCRLRDGVAGSEHLGIARIFCRRGRSSSQLALPPAVLIPRRDGDPQRLLEANIQAIDRLRNGATVGISHHVPRIIHEVKVGAAEQLV